MKGICDLIGKTPMVRLEKTEKYFSLQAELYAKLEMFNPTHSVKDRAALYMIKGAIRSGELRRGGGIVEATSGNLGISLAMLSSVFEYKATIVMPENMTIERRRLVGAYGGELILTDAAEGMAGAIKRAEQIIDEMPKACKLSQFENPLNAMAHYCTTGPEIYRETGGRVDFFVSGVGTSGTLSGVGSFLKKQNPLIDIVAVEPKESSVLSGGAAESHGIQGIGAGFVPPLLDMSLVSRIVGICTDEARSMALYLSLREGIFAGLSSGAALGAAIKIGLETENKGKRIVVIFPDGGEKYLSL